ncbi:bem46 protein, variant [Paraconiothyrium brasiliense]|uniref:Bem46 protein, variant n=1 Tax=Paraconiothyrium brasiliense TaxID=300254 RepID=A0ABR3QI40_9PLEO
MGGTLDSFLSYLRVPLIASSGIAALLSGVLYFKQKPETWDLGTVRSIYVVSDPVSEIIYARNFPPDARTNVPRPAQFGIPDFEELFIPTPDGESLSAFYIRVNRAQSRNVTLLMFHGNAGNIGYRLPIAKVLAEELGCNVFMLQYRGYGLSTGTPNEKGINIDAQTGLDYIRNRHELRSTRIVLYGQSLGGAVSIGLAARNQKQGDIAGVILENTFTSMRKMIPSALPPAKYLAPFCHQVWPSEDLLPQIKDVPVLFLSGLRDEIVP